MYTNYTHIKIYLDYRVYILSCIICFLYIHVPYASETMLLYSLLQLLCYVRKTDLAMITSVAMNGEVEGVAMQMIDLVADFHIDLEGDIKTEFLVCQWLQIIIKYCYSKLPINAFCFFSFSF